MELSPQSFKALASLIHRLTGLVINVDKTYLVRHRLEPIMRDHEIDSFETFVHRLNGRGGSHLQDAVVEAITTKETSFFRDEWLFDAILSHVLPERAGELRRSPERRSIRIWSAGTALGQEAYSLAMLVREFAATPEAPAESRFSILGSDISSESLKFAKAGSYTKALVARGVSDARLSQHFRTHGRHCDVVEAVQRLVTFRRFSLLHPPADLGLFDLVLCRNVMIYFDEPTRQKLCSDLHRVLQRGGWLALGSAESLYGIDSRFETVRVGRAVLYRKA